MDLTALQPQLARTTAQQCVCVEVLLEGQHYPTEHLSPSGSDNNKEACASKMSLFSLYPTLIVFCLVLSLALFHTHFISLSLFLAPTHTYIDETSLLALCMQAVLRLRLQD